MNDLVPYNVSVLGKMDDILHQLTDVELSEPLPVLFNSSIGGHLRHVLEFYEEMLVNCSTGTFSYDRRKRNPLISAEVIAARACVARNISLLNELSEDAELTVVSELPDTDRTSAQRTTLMRELAYLADHGVHHLAMVRIALQQRFPHVTLPEHLGVAASTRNLRAR